MALLWIWLQGNWFTALQGLAIVFGLFFTGLSSHREARSRRIGNIISLTQLHRDLWSEVHKREDLQRVIQESVDLIARPITPAEEEFMNLVLIHFYTGWQMAQLNAGVSLRLLEKDVKSFFSRPIPKAVWEKTRRERDQHFVRFVEKCLRKAK